MARTAGITSAANPLFQETRRAIVRGTLTEGGCCVAESFHLLEEALRSRCEVPAVLAAESALSPAEAQVRGLPGVRVVSLPDRLFQSLAATETSQGVIALVKPPVWRLEQLFRDRPLVVVLDGVQDPGNAGAIARSAEAFGATGIFFLKGSVSPFNAKTLRASAGSLFRLPFLHGVETPEALAACERHRLDLYAGVPPRIARPDAPARAPAEVDLTRPCGFVTGSEAHGVSEEWCAAACGLTIPTAGVESLNAAVAAGILLYEARRQRGEP